MVSQTKAKGGNRLRVFVSGALRMDLAPEREEVTGDWRKLHDEELHDFYPSTNISRVIRSKRMSSECSTPRG
jgi:hypothetical protein